MEFFFAKPLAKAFRKTWNVYCDTELVKTRFAVYCGKLHQPTYKLCNKAGNDVIIDDITGHVTHIKKIIWECYKEGTLKHSIRGTDGSATGSIVH